jgi:hypothetical protein
MKLTLEKDIKIAVELNGEMFLNIDDGMLYQSTENEDEIFLFLKSNKDDKKEIKIRMIKQKINQES